MDDQQTQEKGTFPVDKGEDSVINKGGDTIITCLSEKEPVKDRKELVVVFVKTLLQSVSSTHLNYYFEQSNEWETFCNELVSLSITLADAVIAALATVPAEDEAEDEY